MPKKPPSDAEVRANHRFDEYAGRFDDLFARADQREWFRVYVLGLLNAPERKNVESIATTAQKKGEGNLSQSLQHFITESPWDHARVLARYREQLPVSCRDTAVWVVHDGVFPKKGKNSVGAQRQFARSLDRKVNCQIGVVVGVAGSTGYVPLAARLYLPGYWLRENPELVNKTVPVDHAHHRSKNAIARGLLAELRAEGWTATQAVVDAGYSFEEVFSDDAIVGLGHTVGGDSTHVASANEQFEWLKSRLGLNHFEGRTWVGWHHHLAMVFVAAGFLLAESSAIE